LRRLTESDATCDILQSVYVRPHDILYSCETTWREAAACLWCFSAYISFFYFEERPHTSSTRNFL